MHVHISCSRSKEDTPRLGGRGICTFLLMHFESLNLSQCILGSIEGDYHRVVEIAHASRATRLYVDGCVTCTAGGLQGEHT